MAGGLLNLKKEFCRLLSQKETMIDYRSDQFNYSINRTSFRCLSIDKK